MNRVPAAILVLLSTVACASVRDHVIPFESVNNQIVVVGHMNGSGPYSFLVDTGVDPSVVDTAAATAAGVTLDMTRSGEASGVGSEQVQVRRASIPRLVITGQAYGDIESLSADLSKLSARLGRPLHGILGYSFLKGRVVTIDYSARQLTIGRRAHRSGSAVEIPFSTAPDDIIPIVPLQIGEVSIPVSLDTGSSLSVELYPDAVDRLGLQAEKAEGSEGSIAGARGQAAVRHRTIRQRIAIAGLDVPDVRVTFSERWDHGKERLGNVGNAFLQHFVVTFDYPRRRVLLAPR